MNSRIDPDLLAAMNADEGWRAYRKHTQSRYARVLEAAKPPASVWAPTMTVEEKKAFEQYVIDNNLPF